jgi:hypothetical protein
LRSYLIEKAAAPVKKTEVTTDTLYPKKLALTSPTSGDRSVGIVRLRTKATDFV